jgi:hypothetical protein
VRWLGGGVGDVFDEFLTCFGWYDGVGISMMSFYLFWGVYGYEF